MPAAARPARPRRRGGSARAAAAAGAVLVLSGPAGCTADTAPAPPPLPAPASTVDWVACPLPGGTSVRAVVPPGGGAPWLAAGRRGTTTDVAPAVWTSADGCAWAPAAVRAVTSDGEHTEFVALARRGSTTVALGGAVGQTHGNTRPTLWSAAGAAPLAENQLPRELFGGPSGLGVTGLAAGPAAGFLATGAWSTPQLRIAAQVWSSADGRAWRRVDDAPDLVGTRRDRVSGAAAAAGPGGAVLVGAVLRLGGRPDFDGRAWFAADGRTWRSAAVSGLAGPGDQRLLAAAPRGSGFRAVASAAGRLVAVTSADGRSWAAGAALPGGPFPAAADVAVRLGTLPGGDLLAAAVVDSRLLLWRSADGASWTAEAPPVDRAETIALAAGAGRTVLAVSTPDGPRAWATR